MEVRHSWLILFSTLLLLLQFDAKETGSKTQEVNTKANYPSSSNFHSKTKSNKYFEITDNRLLDVDSMKKSKILGLGQISQVTLKKDFVPNKSLIDLNRDSLKHGQNIEVTRSIGKPYGDPDNYQNIGDGIYLMNDDVGTATDHLKQNHNSREITAKSPEDNSVKSLDDVKTIDKQGNEIAVEKVGQNVEVERLPSEAEFDKNLDVSAHHTMQNNNVEFSENDNIEDVSPNEMKMLNTIQGHLSKDDHLTGMSMKESAEIESLKQNVGEERSGSEYTTVEKAVSTIANQHNDDKPHSLKETNTKSKTTGIFKKDNLLSKRLGKWSEVTIHDKKKRNTSKKNSGKLYIPHQHSHPHRKQKITDVESVQNIRLVNTLTKADPNLSQKHQRRHIKDKSIPQNQVNIKSSKDEKVINLKGKKDFQIDLYISNNDKNTQQREVKSNVLENNDDSPLTSTQGTTIFTSPNGMISTNGVITADDAPDDEDVTVSELGEKKTSSMFKKPQKTGDGHSHLESNNDDGKASNAELEEAISNDAINNADIKSAMADSDLKGLSLIKHALDDQDAKNSVEYYDQPNTKPGKAETSLSELSEEFKEAESNIEDYSAKKNGGSDHSGNVKIVFHMPDHSNSKSKSFDKTIKKKIEEQTEKFLSNKMLKKSPRKVLENKALEAAKAIAGLVEKDSLKKEIASLSSFSKGSDEYSYSRLGTNDYYEEKTPANAEEKLLNQIVSSDAFQAFFFHPTKKEEALPDSSEKLNMANTASNVEKDGPVNTVSPKNTDSSTFIEKTGTNSNEKPSVTGKSRDNFEIHGSTNLKINGGKVLGGNIRGGEILGGTVSGGSVLGGKINGGIISGGTFKDGLLINGEVRNGLVEGGKIRGGKILGGDIKSGLIDGGIVKGGTIEGGHLIDGVIEGGDFKGGEILGGKLLSGEMDGGVLKNGTINGGTLKGGVIESGTLEGGVMLSGTLRGGIIRSGVIRGGTIDKGVVVQDSDVGPGVEIEEGFIKGGKISVKSPEKSNEEEKNGANKQRSKYHQDDNRSNIMYHIEVLPKDTEIEADQFKRVNNINSEKRSTTQNQKYRTSFSLYPTARFDNAPARLRNPSPKRIDNSTKKKLVQSEIKLPKNVLSRFGNTKIDNSTISIGHVSGNRRQLSSNPQQRLLTSLRQQQQQFAIVQDFAKNYKSTPKNMDGLTEHWELTGASKHAVIGSPGPKLYLSRSGVTFKNGHAILDGIGGYLDAGDYQGECFSDPEACSNGFTIHLTLKIYGDSVTSKNKHFILDSGATSPDSRGISVWVSENNIFALIVTRENSWCIKKQLIPFVDRWFVLTLSWRNDKGSSLYVDCDMFDDYKQHFTHDCMPQCPDCHKTDVATRFMFGRPNKGPHFKVTHMALGDVSMYEKYFEKDEVKLMCGDEDTKSKPAITNMNTNEQPSTTLLSQQQQQPQQQQPIQYQQTVLPQIQAYPTLTTNVHQGGQVRSTNILNNVATAEIKNISKDSVSSINKQQQKLHNNDDDGDFLYPTPPGLSAKTFVIEPEPPTPLVNYTTDRRSILYSIKRANQHAGPSSKSLIWSAWSPCSRSCGDGIQTSVKFCQNADKDCNSEGPKTQYKKCMLMPCRDSMESSKKKSTALQKSHSTLMFNGGDKAKKDLQQNLSELKHR